MEKFIYKSIVYEIDEHGFLQSPEKWDENFAEGMAIELGIAENLTNEHWKIINYIRDTFNKFHTCPYIYRTCKDNNLRLSDLKRLFPSGYQRGACLLAGITFSDGYLTYHYIDKIDTKTEIPKAKNYLINSYGFLVNTDDWDENFANLKAEELKMPELLTEKHWEIIHFLRDIFKETGKVPTVYETCEKYSLEADDLERLFPDGYHRGAVKLAGLKLK
jgi:tRNA 2-thiouridine synthesizing protein E